MPAYNKTFWQNGDLIESEKLNNLERQVEAISDSIIGNNNVFEGANSDNDGEVGLVPAPKNTEYEKFLKGNGNWENIEKINIRANNDDKITLIGTNNEVEDIINSEIVADNDFYIELSDLEEKKMVAPYFKGEGAYLRNLNGNNVTIGTIPVSVLPIVTGGYQENGENHNGTGGITPQPSYNDKNNFLKGDGTWSNVFPEFTSADYGKFLSINSDGKIIWESIIPLAGEYF